MGEAVLAGVPAGLAVVDGAALSVRWANPAFVALADERDRAGGAVGLPLDAIPAARAAFLSDRVRAAVDSGVPLAHLETEVRGRTGAPRAFRFSVVPLPRDAGRADALVLAIDVTDQVEARRRAEALASLAADLSRGHRLAHVLATAVSRARALLGPRVVLWTLREGVLQDADLQGGVDPPSLADAPSVGEVLATGRALLVTRTAAAPVERTWLDRVGAGSALLVPLVADERALGVLAIGHDAEGAPPPDEVTLAGAVAAQIALAASKMMAIELERLVAARVALLQTATAAFSAAHATEDVARALFDHGTTAMGADFASIVLLAGPGRLETVASRGLTPDELAYFRSFSTAAPFPTAAAVRLATPVWLEDPVEMDAQFPALARARRGARHHAWAALPLVVRGEAIGGVGLAWKRPHRFTPEERRFLLALVDQCAQAIDRARLFDAERLARARLALSSELAATLATARTREDVVAAVFGAGLATFDASAAAYWERDDGALLRLVGCEGYPPVECAPWRTVAIEAASPMAEAARTGEPVWLASRDELERRFGATAAPVRAGAIAAVPLSVAARSHGVLGLFYDEPHAFDDEERRFVAWLAGKLGEALERAEAYESEREARERAEAAEAEARRIGELQERVMAVVGHDLRTPLQAITLAVRMLSAQTLPPQATGLVARLANSAARMAAIVRDLVEFAKVRSGQALSLERRRVDVALVCERAVRELSDLHPDRRIGLSFGGDTVLEGADADRVAQLVSNLVSNALHHAGREARIGVRVDGAADAVQITVEDDGAGIPRELRADMFEPFRSGGNGGAHLGIGLFVVREIARAHGGDVDVRSEPGRGTTFLVRLPRSAATGAEEPKP